MTYYVNNKEPFASKQIGLLLAGCIQEYNQYWDEFIFLCIGTDQVKGDCMGPMVGEHLTQFSLPDTTVYGTMSHPVHARNLELTLDKIHQLHPHPLIIAIDASFGSKKHRGFITLGNGPLHPGAGVHKQLPLVGDIFITGIVSTSGIWKHASLQTTRISTVTDLCHTIVDGILFFFSMKNKISHNAKRTFQTERPS